MNCEPEEEGSLANQMPLANHVVSHLGRTLPRPSAFSSLKTVEKDLLSSASNASKKGSCDDGRDPRLHEDRVVAMARTRTGNFMPVTSKALRAAVKTGALPADFYCLHTFKRAKDFDSTAEFANYQHQYVLDDTGGGVSIGTAHRRIAAELSGTEASISGHRRHLVLSRNARINAEIGSAVRSVVLAIELSKCCRVLSLDTEFVLDEEDELWLVSATSCKTAARPPIARQRTSTLPTQPRESTGDTKSERVPDADSLKLGGMQVEERGLATEKRSRKREAQEASDVVSDAEFSQLLRSVGYRSPIKKRSGGGSDSRRCRGRPNLTSRSHDQGRKSASNGASERIPEILAPPSRVVSNAEGFRQVRIDERPADSARAHLEWAPEEERGEASTTSSIDERTSDDHAAGQGSSPPCSVSTEGFDYSIGNLDQAGYSRLYGNSQVREAMLVLCNESYIRARYRSSSARCAESGNRSGIGWSFVFHQPQLSVPQVETTAIVRSSPAQSRMSRARCEEGRIIRQAI